MERDRSLTDILGPVEGNYEEWLVRSARRYSTEDMEKKTTEWLRISSMTNKYTGYVSLTPKDIYDWVDTTDNLTSIIMALCSEVKALQIKTRKLEEQPNDKRREAETEIRADSVSTSVSAV